MKSDSNIKTGREKAIHLDIPLTENQKTANFIISSVLYNNTGFSEGEILEILYLQIGLVLNAMRGKGL